LVRSPDENFANGASARSGRQQLLLFLDVRGLARDSLRNTELTDQVKQMADGRGLALADGPDEDQHVLVDRQVRSMATNRASLDLRLLRQR